MEVVGVIAAVPGLIEIIKAVSTGVRGLSRGKVAAKTVKDLLTQLQDLGSILQDVQNKWRHGGSDQLRLQRLSPPLKQLKTELVSLQLLLQNSNVTKEPSRYLKKALFLSTKLEKSLNESFTRLSQLKTSLTLLIAHGQDAITRDLVNKSFSTRRLELQGLLQPSGNSFIPNKTVGTCDWIWSHSTFCDWMQNSTSTSESYLNRTLCIFGIKGCGKSVLVKAVAEEFEAKNKIALHFSFWAGSEAQQKFLNLLRTLVWQILGHIKDENLEQLSEPLIKSPVIDTRVLLDVISIALSLIKERVYFTIDGIDESSEDWNDQSAENLLAVLDLAKNHNNLHVLLAGREHSMRTVLKKGCPRLEITDRLIRDDLQKVISVELGTSLSMHTPTIRDMIQESLEARSQVMFLWTTLVLKELRRCFSIEEVKTTLKQVPHDLDREYHRLLAQLMARTGGTTSKPSISMKRAKYLLYALLACPEPMTCQDLCYAYASQCNSSGTIDDDLIAVGGIMDACGDFLAVTEGRYHLIHTSVSEFLMRRQDEWDCEDSEISYFKVDLSDAHESMRSACFKYIQSIDLGYPLTDDRVSSLPTRFPFISYVAKFLPFHLAQVQDRKGQNRQEAFRPFGTHHFCAFAEFLLVTLHNSLQNQQADFADHWTELAMGGMEFKDLAEHFNNELKRRLQLFGIQHERYQSWLYLAVFFPADNEQLFTSNAKPVTMVARRGWPMKGINRNMLSSLPERVGQSHGLSVQGLSQSLGAVSGMFTVLKGSTADLITSSAESLSIPMILLAATVARQQKKWDLAENLAVSLVRKTKGHRDFYELCSLLTLGGLKVNIHQECSDEAEAMIRKSIEIANHLPVRPQIEMLKVEAYTMLTKLLANTDRSEEAIESAKSLEKIVGKNREKCPSLVWDYSLNHTRRGFAYRVEWLHTTAIWLEKASKYTAAADFTAQAIDIFNESGSEPNSDIIDLYNIQLLALYRGGNYEKLLATCDKHLQIFRKFGSRALDTHTGWKIQTLRSIAYASKGDIREAEKCSCEAADEVHRLGVKVVQPQYELWLIDMMKDLAHLGQYDRSLRMCRELLEIKQSVSTKEKNTEQDTMFIKLEPLVCKLENAGLMDHDYQPFLRCYSLFFLLDDQQDTSDEADWWEEQASIAHEDVPLFEQKASLLALKHVETCLRHDSDLNRAISAYKSLANTQFEQGDLAAAILVSYDAASRLLADFTLDPSTSYIEISEISLSGGDVLKSKSWLVLSYKTQRESTSDARQVFGIEVYFASLYAYMVEAYEEQIESADMRESFIEQACEHLSRAIEEGQWIQHLQTRRFNWTGRNNDELNQHGHGTIVNHGPRFEYDVEVIDEGYIYDAKERRDESICNVRSRLEALGGSDQIAQAEARLEGEILEQGKLKQAASEEFFQDTEEPETEEPRRRASISVIGCDVEMIF